MPRIRVLIADDHAVLRAGLKLLINAQSDMEVVGEAANGPEAVKSAREAAPHVVLLDLSMPGDIDEHGVRQYIRVDRVNYSDGTHSQDNPGYVDLWPQEGDGAGASIVRANPALYGNDPNNWIPATPPTPGLP